jgi:hypothetical protein
VRARRTLLVLLLAALGPPPATARADSDVERRTLAGLAGVHVEIAPVDPELVRAGLDAAALRLETESRLRAAGIPLLEAEA